LKQLSLPRLELTPIVVVEVAAVRPAATSSLLLKYRQPKPRRRCRSCREYSRRLSIVTVANVADVVDATVVLLLLQLRRKCCCCFADAKIDIAVVLLQLQRRRK
jgi:hypothetical protein